MGNGYGTIPFMVHLSDPVRAGIAGAILLGAACYAVFGFQHGFEGQLGWYLLLLPGGMIAAGISDWVRRTPGQDTYLVFWGSLFVLNFLWYFVISFAAIKVYRLAFKMLRRP